MKEILLTQDKVTLVDDEQFDFLNQWKWWLNTNGYACRTIEGKPKNGKRFRHSLYLHKFIMDTDKIIDHINQNKLDNRKNNLRIVNKLQNNLNRLPPKNKYGYKGVVDCNKNTKTLNPFMIRISIKNKNHYAGSFPTPHLAALAYDLWSYDLHREDYKSNFKIIGHSKRPAIKVYLDQIHD